MVKATPNRSISSPPAFIGRIGAFTVLLGFAIFITGIFGGRWTSPPPIFSSVIGMIAVFIGGIVRVYSP